MVSSMYRTFVYIQRFTQIAAYRANLTSFFLFLPILSLCAFYVFSSYDFEYTRHTHAHTLIKVTRLVKEKNGRARQKYTHTNTHT